MRLEIETLRRLLRYEPETGKLYWLERPSDLCRSEGERRRWNGRYAGTAAFSPNSSGYLDGMIFRRMHRAHAVAWALYYGTWHVGDIDHINGDRADNRIANLRQVSRAENSRNQKRRSTNRSGVTGVCSHGVNKWRASICVDRKLYHLGVYSTLEVAAEARKSAETRFGFHENHGRIDEPQSQIKEA